MTTITRGTELDCGGDPLDTWIVERITRTAAGPTLTVRTRRQQCFDRELTGCTTWTADYVRAEVTAGRMVVRAPEGHIL
jgi:hypothetical protein